MPDLPVMPKFPHNPRPLPVTAQEQAAINLARAQRKAAREALILAANKDDYFMGTLVECTAYIAKMDILLGYPNPETKTSTYAKPVEHPKKPNTYYISLENSFGPKLKRRISYDELDDNMSPAQRGKKKTRAQLRSDGGFDHPMPPTP